MEELGDLELMRLYLDDMPDADSGTVFFDDETLSKLVDLTPDLYGAAAAGWKIKAARVAEWYNVSADGTDLTRSQAFRQAMEMSRSFANESSGEVASVKLDNEFIIISDESELA